MHSLLTSSCYVLSVIEIILFFQDYSIFSCLQHWKAWKSTQSSGKNMRENVRLAVDMCMTTRSFLFIVIAKTWVLFMVGKTWPVHYIKGWAASFVSTYISTYLSNISFEFLAATSFDVWWSNIDGSIWKHHTSVVVPSSWAREKVYHETSFR